MLGYILDELEDRQKLLIATALKDDVELFKEVEELKKMVGLFDDDKHLIKPSDELWQKVKDAHNEFFPDENASSNDEIVPE